MIWWCPGCGLETENVIAKCPSCKSALLSSELEYLEDSGDDAETIFELDLDPPERGELVGALVANNVPHRWEGECDLVVSDEYADAVDLILDELIGDEEEDDDDYDDESNDGEYDVISELFILTDRLVKKQEPELVADFQDAASVAIETPMILGIDDETWADIRSAAQNVSRMLEMVEEDPNLQSEIVSLRNQLKMVI